MSAFILEDKSGFLLYHRNLRRGEQIRLPQLDPLGFGVAVQIINNLLCYRSGRCIDRDLYFRRVVLLVVKILRIQEDLSLVSVHKDGIL